MTFTPLFPAGLHDVPEQDLELVFVSGFASSTTRKPLLEGLQRFLDALRLFGVPLEVWLDGSFSTSKENPGDVDLVVFASVANLNALAPDKQLQFRGLIDRTSARHVFGCDVLFARSDDANMRSYWRGWYGFDRMEKPKGIVRVLINP